MSDGEMEIMLHNIARKTGINELREIADRLASLANLSSAVMSGDNFILQEAVDEERYGG